MGIGIFEEFRKSGADISAILSSSVNIYRSYDASRSFDGVVIRTSESESAMVSFRKRILILVPIDEYEVGEISSEWCLGGAPNTIPRTILGLRNGKWLFLSSSADPRTKKFPTMSVAETLKSVPELSSVP